MDMPSVPEGCFSLPEAYRYYLESFRPDGRSLPPDHQEAVESELIEAFKARDIEALVRRDVSTIDVLPPASWGMEEWPGRIFLSPQIKTLSAWAPFNGLVPFVRRDAFQKWVYDQTNSAPVPMPTGHFDGIATDRGPMELPVWSFGIAVAWIMCRSPEVASEYWAGPLDVAMGYLAPGAMSFEAAQAELVHRLASGSLKATATDARGNIQELGAHEWRHLTPQPDGGNNGLKIRLWRPSGDTGGTTYQDVRLLRDEVLAVWPERKAGISSETVPPAGQPGSSFVPPTESELRKQGQWMFLGQAAIWIMCRGEPCSDIMYNAQLDDAERELFRFLDGGDVVVQGYPANGQSRIYENLPDGIWARMNGPDVNKDPQFNPIDDQREDGGTVWVGDHKWSGARLPAKAVFDRWPGAAGEIASVGAIPEKSDGNAEVAIEANAGSKKPDPEGAEKYLRQMAAAFIDEQGPRIGHREWLVVAKEMFGVKNPAARKIYGKMPAGFRGGPGRSKGESSRDRKSGIAS